MIRPWLVLLLSGCSSPAPIPIPPAPPPVVEQAAPVPAAAVAAPKLRAALARAVPREAALVAAPDADANSIALVRLLDSNVRQALRDLERDGGRHVTPAAVQRAKTAVKDLQNHLDEFQAKPAPTPSPDAPPGIGDTP